uniref:Putative secreted protein n=1 Tax=Anopheles triannulatus TaxID=58253 RepID=A0A2M4B2Y9_9DIPT
MWFALQRKCTFLLGLNLVGGLSGEQRLDVRFAVAAQDAAAGDVLAAGGGRGGGHLDRSLALARVRREVGFVEEARKQHEVAEVHRDRQLNVHLGDVARVFAGRLQEPVGPDVDRTADDHLGQLECRDEHGDRARRLEVQGTQRVVRVHDRVDAVVHHDEPPGGSGVLGVREPRVHQHRDVVVPVQKDERLFP